MPNGAAAEQLTPTPQEVPQGEKRPELKLVPPLPAEEAEIPKPVQETLTDKAKETAVSLMKQIA